jgi:hypothetical protein
MLCKPSRHGPSVDHAMSTSYVKLLEVTDNLFAAYSQLCRYGHQVHLKKSALSQWITRRSTV